MLDNRAGFYHNRNGFNYGAQVIETPVTKQELQRWQAKAAVGQPCPSD